MSVFSGSRGEEGNGQGVRANPQTVVAFGVRVEGDFQGEGDIVIDGEVKGKISTAGLLTIGRQAKVEADVTADRAAISGTVNGNVVVKTHLDLGSTARLMGDVTCRTATIESGAVLKGTVSIEGGEGSSQE